MKQQTKFKKTEIGLIPEDWDVDVLNKYIYIKGRIGWKGLKKSEYLKDGSGVVIINGTQIQNNRLDWNNYGRVPEFRYDESPEIQLKDQDIIMTKDGTIGKVAFIEKLPEKSSVASGIFVIRADLIHINQKFLFCYFISPFFKWLIETRKEGSVIPHLYQRDFEEFPISLPPIREQEQISKIIFNLNSKIELLQKQNETLEKIGQEIFKQWFVDFEFPNAEGKPYKSSGGRMVESELGEIPQGWSVGKLGNNLKTVLGGTPSKSKPKYWEGNIPWINSGAINDFPVMNFSETISELGLKNSAAKLMPKGTVVLPFVISVGKEVRISVLGIESSGNQSVLGILENEEYSSEFIYNWIQLRKGHLYLSATGGAQQHINKGNVDSMELLIPEKKILMNFNMATKNVFNKIYLNSEAILSLQKTRDLLLPKLMTGKIRVPLKA